MDHFYFKESLQNIYLTWSVFQSLHLVATVTSENILRSSSINAIMFNCGPLTMDAFSCFRELFRFFQDFAHNLRFKLSLFVVFFWMVHKKKLFKRFRFSIGPLEKTQREVIYFGISAMWLEKMKRRH